MEFETLKFAAIVPLVQSIMIPCQSLE